MAEDEATTMSEDRPARRLHRTFYWIAGLLVAAGLGLSLSAPSPELREASGVQPVSVRSHRVVARTEQPRAHVSGLLEARRDVELFAEAEGRVIEVGAEELDRVEADQLLLRIDPLLAEIELTRAQASLARAKSERRLAASNLERQAKLRGNSVASEAAHDEAVNQDAVAAAALEEARARLATTRDALAKKTMRAPFSGALRLFPVRVGEYVRVGEQVAELIEVDRLRITVGLSDREIVAVEVGAEAHFEVEARPGERFVGRVERKGSALDQASRKFPVQIEVDNADGRLLPGMVARVRLALGGPTLRLAIPREAVHSEFGVDSVFVLTRGEDGVHRAARRRVEVRAIPFEPVDVEVVAGLSADQRIALSALHQLDEGTVVGFVADEEGTPPAGASPSVARRKVEAEPEAPVRVERGAGG